MKRARTWVALVVVVLAMAGGLAWYSAFGRNSAIVDQQQLVPGVETVKNGFVSLFLLDAGHGKVALVDAGNDDSGQAILAALGRRGLGASAVSAIFLTHGHGDHIAACKVFPEAQIYALEADVGLIGDKARVTHPLRDGVLTEVGDLRVETFAVPGHTPGSAAYLARRVLFLGDSAGASKDGVMMQAVRLFSKDPAQNAASLRALEARLQPRAGEIAMLAFAHTGPLGGFEPLAAFARNR
jgi:glyoxylase-like metal-dependent hydrolase (beta-lactamase superfamily II)